MTTNERELETGSDNKTILYTLKKQGSIHQCESVVSYHILLFLIIDFLEKCNFYRNILI